MSDLIKKRPDQGEEEEGEVSWIAERRGGATREF